MKGYLLDTNYLIYLVDPNANSSKKAEVLQDLALKLEDPETLLFLTPLIRYECCRSRILRNVTAKCEKFKILQVSHL